MESFLGVLNRLATRIARWLRGTVRGKLTGPPEGLTPSEKRFVERMLASGNDVEIVPRAPDRTPDFKINRVPKELKTLSGVSDKTSDGISAAIASRVMDARGQSVHVVVDGSQQPGLDREIAERGIWRAFGADNKAGRKIRSIVVMGREFVVEISRR